jgi:TM2 domain-containing membrane protein YozV
MSLPQASRAPFEKYCSDCGSVISGRAEICPRCGVRQTPSFGQGRNRVVAALLAIFLGGFGIHKFYLGRIGQGILCLIFCWTFIPGLVGFIEGIIYLAMNDFTFNKKYGHAR